MDNVVRNLAAVADGTAGGAAAAIFVLIVVVSVGSLVTIWALHRHEADYDDNDWDHG